MQELHLEPESHTGHVVFYPHSLSLKKKIMLIKKSKLELFPLMGEGKSHSDLVPNPTGGSL